MSNNYETIDEILAYLESDFDDLEGYSFEKSVTALGGHGAPISKVDVVAALIRFEGHYSNMAKALNRRRSAIYGYVTRNADVVDLREDIVNEALDDVERQLFLAGRTGADLSTAKWLMETVGKNRGYTKRTELSGPDGGPIKNITTEMTDKEAADAYAAQLKKMKQ